MLTVLIILQVLVQLTVICLMFVENIPVYVTMPLLFLSTLLGAAVVLTFMIQYRG